ncbi:lysozyme inhibitor LprI family protein [Methylosinus sp.]|uniref:lysozyme inhibitor LprI family protein n=1 Tax=Methylosinus sp. TaxID=427 RepID=UPI0039C996EA
MRKSERERRIRAHSVYRDIACSAVILAAILLISSGEVSHSETTANSTAPRGRSCWDEAMTQRDMTDCAMKDFRAADEKLNKSYQAVACYLDPQEKAKLKAAQRAWIIFRDSDCAFWGSGDGSISPMNELMCRARLSDARANELDGWPPNAPRDALAPCN